MKKILVVVDMQNDFIDGPLGTPEARAIVDNVCTKIREGEWDLVYVTMDTHDENYLETPEGKKLPVEHCIENTEGWYLNEKIEKVTKSVKRKTIFKHAFGSWELIDHIMQENIQYHIDHKKRMVMEYTLIGVCTDICVISNALLLKAHYPEMRIVVDASCCAGTTPEKHRMALEVMKSCQVDVVNEPKKWPLSPLLDKSDTSDDESDWFEFDRM